MSENNIFEEDFPSDDVELPKLSQSCEASGSNYQLNNNHNNCSINKNISIASSLENETDFDDGMLLALADNFEFTQFKTQRNQNKFEIPSTHEFQLVTDLDVNLNESFDIEEQPNCNNVENKTIPETSTVSRSIVEEILDDFNGTPSSPERESDFPSYENYGSQQESIVKQILDDFNTTHSSPKPEFECVAHSPESESVSISPEPEFVFKYFSNIRTYSRKKSSNNNSCPVKEEPSNNSNNSAIENCDIFITCESNNLPEIDMDDNNESEISLLERSQKLNENLQNLSAFFSQNQSESFTEIKPEDNQLPQKILQIPNTSNVANHNNMENILEKKKTIENIHNINNEEISKVEEIKRNVKNNFDKSVPGSFIVNQEIGDETNEVKLFNMDKLIFNYETSSEVFGMNIDSNITKIKVEHLETTPAKGIAISQQANVKGELCLDNFIDDRTGSGNTFNSIRESGIKVNNLTQFSEENKQIFGGYLQRSNEIIENVKKNSLNNRGSPLKTSEVFCRLFDAPDISKKSQNEQMCDEEIFSDDSSDFFINYKTQAEHEKSLELKQVVNINVDFVGFETAAGKTIEISEEAKAKANLFLEKSLDIENQQLDKEQILVENKCMENVIKDFVGFETAEGRTIEISEEAKEKAKLFIVNGNQSTEEEKPSKKVNYCEDFVNGVETVVHSNEDVMEFDLAVGKEIKIYEVVKERAKPFSESQKSKNQLYNCIDDRNSEDLKCKQRLSNINETIENVNVDFMGFETAAGRAIEISEQAKDKAKLFIVDENQNSENDQILCNEAKPRENFSNFIKTIDNMNEKLIGFDTTTEKIITISEKTKEEAKFFLVNENHSSENELYNCIDAISEELKFKEDISNIKETIENTSTENMNVDFIGFETAGGRAIDVSEEAKEKAKLFLVNENESLEIEKTPCIERKSKNLECKGVPNIKETIANVSVDFLGFETGKRKIIELSKEAEEKAKLNETENLKNEKITWKENTSNIVERIENINKDFIGFETAGGKGIEVSEEAKIKAKHFLVNENQSLKDERNCCIKKDFVSTHSKEKKMDLRTNEILNLNTEISEKPKEPVFQYIENYEKSSNDIAQDQYQSMDDDTDSEIEVQKLNEIKDIDETMRTCTELTKRTTEMKDVNAKLFVSNKEIVEKALSQNSLLEKENKIISHSIISRKNLLSLSKRRKKNISKNKTKLIESSTLLKYGVVKDIKKQEVMECSTLENKEMDNDSTKEVQLFTTSTPHVNKTLNNSQMISSIKSSTPNVQQRIEHFINYNIQTPNISPIRSDTAKAINTCRPSGLRRSIRKRK